MVHTRQKKLGKGLFLFALAEFILVKKSTLLFSCIKSIKEETIFPLVPFHSPLPIHSPFLIAMFFHCFFFLSFIIAAAAPGLAQGRVHHHRWEAKYELKSPDCYTKPVLTINGASPGPTIFATKGDTIVVDLTNSLFTENLAVHWHGIRQIGTPSSDGTEGVTQCAILPGDTFRYRFVVDRPGTYMYHAHYGLLKEGGLYGSIQVASLEDEPEPFTYDHDRSIFLNDWYHKSPIEVAAGLSSRTFRWPGEPQSILINGRGRFNCSSLPATTCNQTNPECAPYSLIVVPGKTYRLRIRSLTSLSALAFQIEDHEMIVVESDGHFVEPFSTSALYIYSGESYSVLIKAKQNGTKNYWMSASIVGRNPATDQGLAILSYYPNVPSRSPSSSRPTPPIWNDTASRVAQAALVVAHKDHVVKPPVKSDRVIILLNTQNNVDGRRKWAMNNISLSLPQTPYLVAMKQKLSGVFESKAPPDTYDMNYDIYKVANNTNATISNGVYKLRFNSTVDIILQNANSMVVNVSEIHPWHLHGHDFWVLGQGEGKFRPGVDEKKYNLKNPIMKNTVGLQPYRWVALRIIANNPGFWIFHCHIEFHFFMGMAVVFEEGVERVGKLPSSIMGCGATKNSHFKP